MLVHPTPRHASLLRGLVSAAGTAGNLTTDAHLAALSLEYGGRFARMTPISRDSPESQSLLRSKTCQWSEGGGEPEPARRQQRHHRCGPIAYATAPTRTP
jgi:hypothetical protein